MAGSRPPLAATPLWFWVGSSFAPTQVRIAVGIDGSIRKASDESVGPILKEWRLSHVLEVERQKQIAPCRFR